MKISATQYSPLLALLLALHLPTLYAQSGCSSDGAKAPQALFERFILADCADCWADAATPAPGPTAAVLDWIVPSAAGDDAALSAAARRDSIERLESLQRALPSQTDVAVPTRATTLPGQLRVAFGPAVNDYVGTVVSYAGKRGGLCRQQAQNLAGFGGKDTCKY